MNLCWREGRCQRILSSVQQRIGHAVLAESHGRCCNHLHIRSIESLKYVRYITNEDQEDNIASKLLQFCRTNIGAALSMLRLSHHGPADLSSLELRSNIGSIHRDKKFTYSSKRIWNNS